MKYAIFSDIHANVTALNAVLTYIRSKYSDEEMKVIILGDFINYGPRPNETIKLMNNLNLHSIIIGNHEKSIIDNNLNRFSSQRGVECIKYTRSILTQESYGYIQMINRGILEIMIEDRSVLLVHGDLSDVFWGKMTRIEMENINYAKYDYVFSGHTHIPHFNEVFYASNNSNYRFKKKTIFINPGSIGQPRNHNPMAQFCAVDLITETFCFEKVYYDIDVEARYFNEACDPFYKNRIKVGI